MNQHTAGKPHESGDVPHTRSDDVDGDLAASADALDEIDEALDRLTDIDPADSVAVLADITASLNREIDADQENS